MARKASSTISQEELYPRSDGDVRADLDDARLVDLDVEEQSPFLRGQKRVSVRRNSLSKKAAAYLGWILLTTIVVFLGSVTVAAAYHYGEHSWRFRIESSDDIEITGHEDVLRSQIIEVMGGDIGRNVFYVPLALRKKQLEQIPRVETASVMRFVPNRLKIVIHERTPVAFARVGSKIFLIDSSGVLMDLPASSKKKFSFPVILGMSLAEPQSMRGLRMNTYKQVVSELDSTGAHYSKDLSELDLSDPDDVKVLTDDTAGPVLVHLGTSEFLDRFKIYITHVQEWRRQFAKLDSVDLRYEHQIVVNPDLQGTAKQPAMSASAVRAAMAAGVKSAALITHEGPKTLNPAASIKISKPTMPKNRVAKHRHGKPVGKQSAHAGETSTTTQMAGDKPAAAPSVSPTPGTSGVAKINKPSPGIPKGQQ
ncbi:MAG: FtsQ-type POTRA domain-containing protein [Acidobacteriaceae bacterium]|nr:FtsQ-type POTRA domain-containing protein [Acidobacteriaceae bacterium]